jgi:hypothetical protein
MSNTGITLNGNSPVAKIKYASFVNWNREFQFIN